jgi:hypothetical protein
LWSRVTSGLLKFPDPAPDVGGYGKGEQHWAWTSSTLYEDPAKKLQGTQGRGGAGVRQRPAALAVQHEHTAAGQAPRGDEAAQLGLGCHRLDRQRWSVPGAHARRLCIFTLQYLSSSPTSASLWGETPDRIRRCSATGSCMWTKNPSLGLKAEHRTGTDTTFFTKILCARASRGHIRQVEHGSGWDIRRDPPSGVLGTARFYVRY